MPNSYATEADNGVITSVFPVPNVSLPHVALHLSHASWLEGAPVVLVAWLSPDDARAIAVSLSASADRVQVEYDGFLAAENAGEDDE